jgi:hypothetical protein
VHTVSRTRFAISYTPALRPLFTLLGLGPGLSYVEVDGQSVRVRMGWAFAVDVPCSSIRSIQDDEGRVTGWGVHGWGGRWLVNGSSDGLLRLDLDPPAPARAVGFPVQMRTLRVSLEQPNDLRATLARP